MALSLSSLIRFGTSTWAYEGWQGQVYQRQYLKSTFARECLGEYGQYLYNGEALFRTVGNDATFYRPPTEAQFEAHTGPFLFEFQRHEMSAIEFLGKLDQFFSPTSETIHLRR